MIPATEAEFEAQLKKFPLAVPDGFGLVGSLMQTRWKLFGKEIARMSWDSHDTLYDICES